MNDDEILSLMIKAAIEAGKVVMAFYQSGFKVQYKDDDSPVTSADLAASSLIRKILSPVCAGWLCEEDSDSKERLSLSELFIVDPLDGTQDFVNRNGSFSINIAFIRDHKPVLSVIGLPAKNGYAYARKGAGAYIVLDGKKEKLAVSRRTSGFVYGISMTHNTDEEKAFASSHASLISSTLASGASTKGVLLAMGQVDASVRLTRHTKEWDVAAMDLLVKEAGGVFLDGKGKEFAYNRKDVYNRDGYSMFNSEKTKELFLG